MFNNPPLWQNILLFSQSNLPKTLGEIVILAISVIKSLIILEDPTLKLIHLAIGCLLSTLATTLAFPFW